MAHKEYFVTDIMDVLRRLEAGDSIRKIFRTTGIDRKTITRYRTIAIEHGFGSKEGKVELPDIALAVFKEIRRPNPGPLRKHDRLLRQWNSKLKEWLGEEKLTLTKAHVKLKRSGVKVSYSSLYRYAREELGFGSQQNTVRLAPTDPGEVAQADFGQMGIVYDSSKGRNRKLHALVVTLCFSRYQYVYLTFDQTFQALVHGIEEAWEFFGGTTRRLIVDNMKAAVVKADRYEPVFNRVFKEYSEYRGFIIDATVPGHPKGKGMVENQVRYVRENFFKGEDFIHREQAQKAAIQWCRTVAGLRIHGTTRKLPLLVFEQEEQTTLGALSVGRYDPPSWGECKVHPDHHINFERSYYSLPTKFIGKNVFVRGSKTLVHIYLKGELVKTHGRVGPGERSTDYSDYPAEKGAYAMRSVNYYISRAKDTGEATGRFAAELLSGEFPWSRIRQAQKLLRLADKYGSHRIELVCRRALAFGLDNVNRLEGMLRRGIEQEEPNQPTGVLVRLGKAKFGRDASYFCHESTSGKEECNGSHQ